MGSFFGALVCRTDNVPEGDHYSEEQADQQTPWIGPREIPDGITDDRTTKKPPEKIRKNPVTAAIVRIGPGSLGKVTLFFALLGGCKPLFSASIRASSSIGSRAGLSSLMPCSFEGGCAARAGTCPPRAPPP